MKGKKKIAKSASDSEAFAGPTTGVQVGGGAGGLVIGAVLGGPVGAVLGGVIGSHLVRLFGPSLDERKDQLWKDIRPTLVEQYSYIRMGLQAEADRYGGRLISDTQKRIDGQVQHYSITVKQMQAEQRREAERLSQAQKQIDADTQELIKRQRKVRSQRNALRSLGINRQMKSIEDQFGIGPQVESNDDKLQLGRHRTRESSLKDGGKLTQRTEGENRTSGGPPAHPPMSSGGNSSSGNDNSCITRFPDATFPSSVELGQIAPLRVCVTCKPRSALAARHAMILDVPKEMDHLTLGVTVSVEGFDIIGDSFQFLIVPLDRDSEPLVFPLRATSPGNRKISVEFFQKARYAGSLALQVQVLDEATQTTRDTTCSIQGITVLYTDPVVPDVTFRICQDEIRPGEFTYGFSVHSESPEIDLWHHQIKQKMPPLCEPSRWVSEQFAELETLYETQEKEHIPRTIETIGANLYELLFPDELKGLWMKRIRRNVKSIQIVSDEPWIPWELIRPSYTDGEGLTKEDGFLCEDYLVGRWLAGSPPPPELTSRTGTVIIPRDSGLTYAREEADVLNCLGLDVSHTPALLSSVRGLLERGGYDFIHFACHANFQPKNHEQSCIFLERKEKLLAREIVGKQSNFSRRHRPLVFINACRSARAGFAFAGIGSWAHRFINTKSSAFVGCAWSVDDEAAYRFAEAFYRNLENGHNLGEAVRLARFSAKRIPGNTSWLSYVLYGDPLARVKHES